MNKQAFLHTKEQRLEALIRGGFLKQHNARDKLIAFTQHVRHVLQEEALPKQVFVLAMWAFVALC